MDPAAFFQGFEGSLVAKLCSAEVFLLLVLHGLQVLDLTVGIAYLAI